MNLAFWTMGHKKNILLTIVFITITSTAYSQSKIVSVSKDDEGWYKFETEVMKRTGLPNLETTKEKGHWRFWLSKYIAANFAVDIIGTDSLHCEAFVTLYTYGDVVRDEKKAFEKIYHEQVKVDSGAARILYNLAQQIKINGFSRSDVAPNGSIVMYNSTDSAPCRVEYGDDKTYMFKTGLKPDNVKAFKHFGEVADDVIHFEKLKDAFEKNIPFGYYSSDKWMFIQRHLTAKQIREYKRYWKKHST
jgi:hypothetical protein